MGRNQSRWGVREGKVERCIWVVMLRAEESLTAVKSAGEKGRMDMMGRRRLGGGGGRGGEEAQSNTREFDSAVYISIRFLPRNHSGCFLLFFLFLSPLQRLLSPHSLFNPLLCISLTSSLLSALVFSSVLISLMFSLFCLRLVYSPCWWTQTMVRNSF